LPGVGALAYCIFSARLSLTGFMRMAQRTKQGLDDVKLALERLQRIALDPSEGDAQSPNFTVVPPPEPPVFASRRPAEPSPPRQDDVAGKFNPAIAGAVLAAFLVVVVGIVAWRVSLSGPGSASPEPLVTAATKPQEPPKAVDLPEPPPAPPPAAKPQDTAKAVDLPALSPPARPPATTSSLPLGVADAHSLLDAGSVTRARAILADLAPQSSEAALMMARSYDPNYLQQLANPDAGPDIAQAERWYRTWHDMAGKNGLVMEADRLERIIKAMK
jgi:hypothetical protein